MKLWKALIITLTLLNENATAQQYYPSFRISQGFSFLPTSETYFSNTKYLGGSTRSLELNYSLLHDQQRRYNGWLYGFTTGIWHTTTKDRLEYDYNTYSEESKSLSIPVLWLAKAPEWNDAVRLGVVTSKILSKESSVGYPWKTREYSVDAYFSFGYESILRRNRRTDGWIMHTEVFLTYDLLAHTEKQAIMQDYRRVRVARAGFIIGVAYVFDWYHYRGWYNN